jgi:hypothetical protein
MHLQKATIKMKFASLSVVFAAGLLASSQWTEPSLSSRRGQMNLTILPVSKRVGRGRRKKGRSARSAKMDVLKPVLVSDCCQLIFPSKRCCNGDVTASARCVKRSETDFEIEPMMDNLLKLVNHLNGDVGSPMLQASIVLDKKGALVDAKDFFLDQACDREKGSHHPFTRQKHFIVCMDDGDELAKAVGE